MAAQRKAIPLAVKQQVLHEAGYRCGNPICRTIITLEIHHLDHVSEGGENNAENLIALCPNCHSLHHKGEIPKESLQAWKYLQFSLNEGFDKVAIDVLLAMDHLNGLSVSGDGFVQIAGLVTGGYLRIAGTSTGAAHTSGVGAFNLVLTDKGKCFIQAWKRGDQRKAIEGLP
jgi:cytochrome c553